jgi:hypothetical protein
LGKKVLFGRAIHPVQPTLFFRDEPFHPFSEGKSNYPDREAVDQFGGVEKNRGRVGLKRGKIRVPVDRDPVLEFREMGFLLLGQCWARLDDIEFNNERQVGMGPVDRIQQVVSQKSAVGTLFTDHQRGWTSQCGIKLV